MKSAATASGTRSYFEKNPTRLPGKLWGRTGLTVSRVGFGCYRVDDGSPEHAEALRQALRSGCNLIDTSTNYGDGGSERLVGKVLGELVAAGELQREQVVVVTKAGYVQGSNLELAREHKTAGRPFPEMVEYSPQCWHCISPEFLRDQLDRSLDRLGLETVDVLLLDNPEYFLKVRSDHDEYYRRVRAAFAYLEEEVKRGRIRHYGISSNTFPDPVDSPEFTSLEAVLDAAAAIGPENHFSVIQFPLNLFEAGAAFEANNAYKTVTELAALRGIGTLINRPLNSFVGNKLVRLASFDAHHGVDFRARLSQAFEKAMTLESGFPGEPALIRGAAWAHILKQNLERIPDIVAWKDILNYQVHPALEALFGRLGELPQLSSWLEQYEPAISDALAACTEFYESAAAIHSQWLSQVLDRAVPALASSKTLSQKALRTYLSLPGVDCVLVGMREPGYVADALATSDLIDVEQAHDAFEAVHDHASQAQNHPSHPHT